MLFSPPKKYIDSGNKNINIDKRINARKDINNQLSGLVGKAMNEPAQRYFVKQCINWERASERLGRYKHIAEIFPIEKLQECVNKAPFYCHYLGWRLGTWEEESFFKFFDELLEIVSVIPGWEKESRVPGGCEFDKFWGFLWELQTAAFFANHLGLKAEWKKAGPDIQLMVDSRTFFAECTTYRKSFALEEFISELFRCILPQVITRHVPCLKFSLPKNNNIDDFLDSLFAPYLDPSFLPRQLKEVRRQSPWPLPIPSGTQNFHVYLENLDAVDQNYKLKQILTSAGDPETFLKLALKEILGNKALSNMLLQNRPNLLMVNFLLGADWQLAKNLRSMPKPDLGKTYDGVLLAACGIDKIPTFQSSFIDFHPGHPIGTLTGRFW